MGGGGRGAVVVNATSSVLSEEQSGASKRGLAPYSLGCTCYRLIRRAGFNKAVAI